MPIERRASCTSREKYDSNQCVELVVPGHEAFSFRHIIEPFAIVG